MNEDRLEFSERFRERLKTAVQRSGMNYKEVSVRARGPQHPKTVANILSSKSIPGADIVQSLAIVLNVSSDYLLGMPHTSTTLTRSSTGTEYGRVADHISADFSTIDLTADDLLRPPIDSVLAWWRHNNRKMVRTRAILDYCDIYRRPSRQKRFIQPLEIGPLSLAGQFLKSSDVETLQEEFKQMPRQALEDVVSWHIKTAESKNLLSVETLVYTTATGVSVSLEYARLLLAVVDHDGTDDLVLCYARPFEVKTSKLAE